MFQHSRLNSDQSFFQKVKNLDYILIFCILILSIVSLFVMYSTDGGEILFHTKSHLMKLSVFFVLMLVISFFNIKLWHISSYVLYIATILLLIWVSFYGIKVSGSQRGWSRCRRAGLSRDGSQPTCRETRHIPR